MISLFVLLTLLDRRFSRTATDSSAGKDDNTVIALAEAAWTNAVEGEWIPLVFGGGDGCSNEADCVGESTRNLDAFCFWA